MISRYEYPCSITPDPDGGFAIRFPDVPEAISEANTVDDIPEQATDAVVAALSFYIETGTPLPVPSLVAEDQLSVLVPPIAAAKLGLYEVMTEQAVCRAELARRLCATESVVCRLLDLDRRCDINRVDHALRTLGRRVVVSIRGTA